MILAQLITAWSMQRDGKAGIHRSNNILCSGVRAIVTRNGEMLCLGGSTKQIMRRASRPSFFMTPRKMMLTVAQYLHHFFVLRKKYYF
jgi:hypothetical protein